jgi:hypothetical protein
MAAAAKNSVSLGKTIETPLISPGIDISRDIRLVVGPNGTDLSWAKEVDCLTQDLSIALTTAKTSDPFNVDFGFDGVNALVEETEAVLVRERVRIGIISLLQRDQRVRNVLDVQLYDSRSTGTVSLGGISQPLTGVIPSERELVVAVSFETISFQQFSIKFGGGT